MGNPTGKEIINMLFDEMRKGSGLHIHDECFRKFEKENLSGFESHTGQWPKAEPTLRNAARQHGIMATAAALVADSDAQEVRLKAFKWAGKVVRKMCKLKIHGLFEEARKKSRETDEDQFKTLGEWCTWP
jgi:hypothetical protein